MQANPQRRALVGGQQQQGPRTCRLDAISGSAPGMAAASLRRAFLSPPHLLVAPAVAARSAGFMSSPCCACFGSSVTDRASGSRTTGCCSPTRRSTGRLDDGADLQIDDGAHLLLGYAIAYALVHAAARERRLICSACCCLLAVGAGARLRLGRAAANDGLVNARCSRSASSTQPLPLVRNEFGVVIGMVHVHAAARHPAALRRHAGHRSELIAAARGPRRGPCQEPSAASSCR